MTKKVLELCAKELMVSEGGFTDDPRDRGNWTTGVIGSGECKGTKYGISAMAYPNEDIKNLTQERAIELFKKDYWDKCKCDDLPDALSIIVSDCAYNSGYIRANKILQKCLGVAEDGIIGKITLGKIKDFDLKDLVEKYSENRLLFLKSLSTWNIYGKGWGNRVEKIKDLALQYV